MVGDSRREATELLEQAMHWRGDRVIFVKQRSGDADKHQRRPAAGSRRGTTHPQHLLSGQFRTKQQQGRHSQSQQKPLTCALSAPQQSHQARTVDCWTATKDRNFSNTRLGRFQKRHVYRMINSYCIYVTTSIYHSFTFLFQLIDRSSKLSFWGYLEVIIVWMGCGTSSNTI